MGKLFDWLFGKAEELEDKTVTLTETVDSVTDDKKVEPTMEELLETERFVDPETGKEYKTSGALKGAITCRKNKAAKKNQKTKK